MRGRHFFVLLWLATLLALRSAHAGSLADVFRSPRFAQLGLAPLGDVLATTVAVAYPVASSSSSIVYEYDPELDTMERRSGIAGPLFGERAETIGKGQLNVALVYTYVDFTTLDGDDLSSLRNRRQVDGSVLTLRVPGGVTLQDGRFTTRLPVRVVADVDVTAHQMALSATYGVTPRLDVNLTVPVLHTSLGLSARGRAPDPRFPEFALAGGGHIVVEPSDSAESTGVGDVLLRAKYLVSQGGLMDVAAGLGLALPSGDEDDFQGAGTTRLQPMLVVSRVFAGRFEPFVDVGIDVNTGDADRSMARWAVGGSVEAVAGLTGVVAFLGRNEFGAQADDTQSRFFFPIERSDVYDVSLGLRWRFAESGIVSANVIVPLNREGIRADAVPGFDVEYAF